MVTLKASHEVKPAGDTPGGIMYIPELDQAIAITHAPTIYFYRLEKESEINAAEILKDSLSKALVVFYPLAGRLQWIDQGLRMELDCNSMGALFLEAESEAKIDDYEDFRPTPEIRALIPSVDYNKPIHELPLVLVQLTKFSCGGISVGLGISHVLVDGLAAGHFISNWARIARGEQIDHIPFLDRTKLRPEESWAPSFDQPEFKPPPLLIGHSSNLEERKKETTVAMLKLSENQIQELKKRANSTNSTFTRYEVVAAHVWRCACKARGHKSEQVTNMRFAVDFRNRLKPPLPKGYFGNAILPTVAIATSGELVSKPLAYASGKIRQAKEKITNEYIWSSLAFLKNEPNLSRFRHFHIAGCTRGLFNGNPSMAITSWSIESLFGADFGWGKEIYFGPGMLAFDGKSFIIPDNNEDGSFVVALCLQVEHMNTFKKFFYEDI
ncbi:spermidine hydroxycinnamoyl transferase-like [Actinidia eriantha]|uniref:spermidine hydroxycinnamoyl transferase-like n=1 Tax=Actinidia eriantha TaxID=165200 RepID=UPI002589C850|nr:spermidine hydroxycinnamoyl transferase-like [Actinidia eriantha]